MLSVGSEAVIIDCGAYTHIETERIRRYIEENNLTPKAHLLTHGHLDHVFGVKWVHDMYGLVPFLNAADKNIYNRIAEQAALFGIPFTAEHFTPTEDVSSDFRLIIGEYNITALHTPGHTEGSVCYLVRNNEKDSVPVLFSGDTLFQGGYGRTDLPGGDSIKLIKSLSTLSSLPSDTIVYPGHGYTTTIADERLG